ncbi:MAG: ATP synthase F1 subunit delta [Bacteroidota bacterium]
MIEIKLGDRYAKSVLELAKEMDRVEEVRADFNLIETICDTSRDFVNMLKSPLIKADKKQEILDAILGGKLSKITATFIRIIVSRGREPYLRDIAIRFQRQYDLYKNISRGTITSAAPLSPAQSEAIQKLVATESKTEFVLTEQVDPKLIGGFTLRIDDFLFDGSLASRLRELKQEFDNNPYVKQI